MKWTEKAIETMKRFAAGVDCPEWDEDTIKDTMFNDYCQKSAIKKRKQEIDEEIAKEYILITHNPITVRKGRRKNSPVEAIRYCMVRPVKKDKGWVAVHGKKVVFPITEEEAELLKNKIEKLLKGSQ